MTVGFTIAGLANLTMIAVAYSGTPGGIVWDLAEYLSAIGAIVGGVCAILTVKAISGTARV